VQQVDRHQRHLRIADVLALGEDQVRESLRFMRRFVDAHDHVGVKAPNVFPANHSLLTDKVILKWRTTLTM